MSHSVLRWLMPLVLVATAVPAWSQQEGNTADLPVGQFVTVRGAVDQAVSGRIQNLALQLAQDAIAGEKKRKAYLILEIQDGSSQFGLVRDLAKFLRSPKLNNLTTVAWIPETVTGNNVVLALACEEIIMHPEASLGDIGRGTAVDRDDSAFVLNLVEDKHNRMLSAAIVEGMLSPNVIVNKATITRGEGQNKQTETVMVTPAELDALSADPAVAIENVNTIKERGEVGLYSGEKARAETFLIVNSALNRGEVADLYNLPREALHEDEEAGKAVESRLIRIDEPITEVMSAFLDRQIERARSDGAGLVIFELNTSQGLLLPSLNLANRISELRTDEIRTIAWIPGDAIGGAALVALACDELYMTETARIGDISSGLLSAEDPNGDDVDVEAVAEDLQFIRQRIVELSEETGRPAAVFLAMLDPNLEIRQATNLKTGRISYLTAEELANNAEWKQGPVVAESTKQSPMVLDGDAAHRLRIAEPPVQDLAEVRLRVGIPDDVKLKPIDRTWVDVLIFWLNTPLAMFILIVAGIVCIYLEFHMVSGLFGILAALCFGIFFWSRFLGGTAGWLEVMLFFIGIVCIAIEFFVIPGFGVFGISGGLLIFTSLVMAAQTFGNLEPNADQHRIARTLGTLSGSVVTVVVLAAVMSKYLPRMPILNQLILTPPSMGLDPDSPMLRPELTSAHAALTGKQGITQSVLRPAGKVMIEDEFHDVVSDGPYIEQGTTVEVVRIDGNRIIVREV